MPDGRMLLSGFVAAAIVAMVGFAEYVALTREIPTANEKLVSVLIVAILGGLGTLLGYLWGSSQGSRDKDAIIAQLRAQLAGQPPPAPSPVAPPPAPATPPAAAATLAAIGVLLGLLFAAPAAQAQSRVSVALVLAVDVSTSVDGERFRLQREGYAAAFEHPHVIDAILRSSRGRIAVDLMEWASADAQRVVVPWMEISDAESGQIFAARLLREPRPFDGWTSISGAIDAAVRLLDAGPPADRRVIDVSGDGVNNSGRPAALARDEALARGITINGLAIMTTGPPNVGESPLDAFYRDNVAGGPGAFVMTADGFETFAYAIVGKVVREVADVAPPPRRVAGVLR